MIAGVAPMLIGELGPDVIEPLRGLTVTLRLESWAQATDLYNLRVAYTSGP